MDTNAKAHNGQERSAGGRASADRRGGLLGCRGEVMESDEGSGTKPQGRPAAAPGLAAPAGCSEAAAPAKAGGRPLDTSAPNWRRIKPHGGMDMHHPATGAAVLMLEDACDEEQADPAGDGRARRRAAMVVGEDDEDSRSPAKRRRHASAGVQQGGAGLADAQVTQEVAALARAAVTAAAAVDAGRSGQLPSSVPALALGGGVAPATLQQSLNQAMADARQAAALAAGLALLQTMQQKAQAAAAKVGQLEVTKNALQESCRAVKEEVEQAEEEAEALATAAEEQQQQLDVAQERVRKLQCEVTKAEADLRVELHSCGAAVEVNVTAAGIVAALEQLRLEAETLEADRDQAKRALQDSRQQQEQLRSRPQQLQSVLDVLAEVSERARPLFDFLRRQQDPPPSREALLACRAPPPPPPAGQL